MEVLTIRFQESVKEKLMKFLATFSESELTFSESYIADTAKNEVREDYEHYKSGKSELFDADDIEKEMDDLISENEN